MKATLKFSAMLFLMIAFGNAQAIPMLQLDIGGGTYDTTTETTITSDPTFTLYAYLTPDKQTGSQTDAEYQAYLDSLLNMDYYISSAIVPKTSSANDDFGSFMLDGVSYDYTDMSYGTPPLENNPSITQLYDPLDLQKHDIFDTSFLETKFKFDGNNIIPAFNVQDGTTANRDMYVAAFDFDIHDLFHGINLHFDLYDTVVKSNGDIDRNDFAPFSHDAGTAVPEPQTLVLFLSGLIFIGGITRWKNTASHAVI